MMRAVRRRAPARIYGVATSLVVAAYAALIAWMHAIHASALFSRSVPINVAIFSIIAVMCVVLAGWINHRRGDHPPWMNIALGFLLVGTAATLPGRLLVLAHRQPDVAGDAERLAHDALRVVIAAQEDFRIVHGRYARTASELDSPLMAAFPRSARIEIADALDSTTWNGATSVLDASTWSCRVEVGRRQTSRQRDNYLNDDVACTPSQGSSGPASSSALNARTGIAASAAQAASFGSAPQQRTNHGRPEPWPMERADPAQSGVVDGPNEGMTWSTPLSVELRALPSIAGGRIFVGAHGSGSLSALDIADGHVVWHTRLPNWIHQDPTSDGGLVFVGVGDKNYASPGSPIGLGIGGVAALDFRTGRVAWFATRAGAVMTAPAIAGDRVIVADGSGKLSALRLATGDALWTRAMRGRGVMASPLTVDSMLYVAQDPRSLCAYSIHDGSELWCYDAPPEFALGGDATPSIIGRTIYWGVARPTTGLVRLRRGVMEAFTYAFERLTGRGTAKASQWLFAIDRITGQERWRHPLGGDFEPRGNISGTAVSSDGAVVVVSPLARKVVALDSASGRIRWERPLDAFSRGAPTIVDTLILLSDGAAHLHVLNANDGTEICHTMLPDAPDRSGPVVTGQTVLFAGLRGLVFARPLRFVVRCVIGSDPSKPGE